MAVRREDIDTAMRHIESGMERIPYHDDYLECFPVPCRTKAQCIAINRFVQMRRVRIVTIETDRAHLQTLPRD